MKKNDLNKLKVRLPILPGILGKEEHVNASILVPFVLIDKEYYLLFEKRAQDIRQGGEICFPGGVHNPDTDAGLKDTAVREAVEELGIPAPKIRIFGQLDTLVAGYQTTVDAFPAEVFITKEELKCNPEEVESAFFIPVSFFEANKPEKYQVMTQSFPYCTDENGCEVLILPYDKLQLPDRYRRPWGAYRHDVYAWITDYGAIWGITARIILDVVQKIHLPESDTSAPETKPAKS